MISGENSVFGRLIERIVLIFIFILLMVLVDTSTAFFLFVGTARRHESSITAINAAHDTQLAETNIPKRPSSVGVTSSDLLRLLQPPVLEFTTVAP